MINSDVQMSINSALTQIMTQVMAGKVRRKEYKVSGGRFNVAVKSIQTQHQIINDIHVEYSLVHMAYAYVIAIGAHHIGITHTEQIAIAPITHTNDLIDPIKQKEYTDTFVDFTIGTSSTNGDMDASLTHIKTYLESISTVDKSREMDIIQTFDTSGNHIRALEVDGHYITTIESRWEQMGSKMPRITIDRTKMLKIKHNKKYSSAFASLKHRHVLASTCL